MVDPDKVNISAVENVTYNELDGSSLIIPKHAYEEKGDDLSFIGITLGGRQTTSSNFAMSNIRKCVKGSDEIKTIKFKSKNNFNASTIWENGRNPMVIVNDVNGRVYNKSEIGKLISRIRFLVKRSDGTTKYDDTISGTDFPNKFNNNGNVWYPNFLVQQGDSISVTVVGKDWATMSKFSRSYPDGTNSYTQFEITSKTNIKDLSQTVTFNANSVIGTGSSKSDYVVFYITLNHMYSTTQLYGYFTTDNSGGFFDWRFNMTVWLTLQYASSPNVALDNINFQLLIDDALKLDTGNASINDGKLIMSTGKNISNDRHKYTMRCAPKNNFIDWTAINVYSYSGYFETSKSNVTWGGSAYASSGGGGGYGGGGGSNVSPWT